MQKVFCIKIGCMMQNIEHILLICSFFQRGRGVSCKMPKRRQFWSFESILYEVFRMFLNCENITMGCGGKLFLRWFLSHLTSTSKTPRANFIRFFRTKDESKYFFKQFSTLCHCYIVTPALKRLNRSLTRKEWRSQLVEWRKFKDFFFLFRTLSCITLWV